MGLDIQALLCKAGLHQLALVAAVFMEFHIEVKLYVTLCCFSSILLVCMCVDVYVCTCVFALCAHM